MIAPLWGRRSPSPSVLVVQDISAYIAIWVSVFPLFGFSLGSASDSQYASTSWVSTKLTLGSQLYVPQVLWQISYHYIVYVSLSSLGTLIHPCMYGETNCEPLFTFSRNSPE